MKENKGKIKEGGTGKGGLKRNEQIKEGHLMSDNCQKDTKKQQKSLQGNL